jgi:hypothetical protein
LTGYASTAALNFTIDARSKRASAENSITTADATDSNLLSRIDGRCSGMDWVSTFTIDSTPITLNVDTIVKFVSISEKPSYATNTESLVWAGGHYSFFHVFVW